MTYRDAIQFLSGIQVFGQQLGLDAMRDLLRRVGNPEKNLRFIHIAGTNGKGSVAAMTQSALTAAGFRTGLYTSPHLVSFCERIQLDGNQIAESDVARLIEQIRPHLAATQPRPPTLFEVVTAIALQYYREQNADVIAWETGLGGRLDATNVVTPLVSVITKLDFDHTQYLGDTLAKIAAEKAGIIKHGRPVVCSVNVPEALDVIRNVANEHKSPLTIVGEQIHFTRTGKQEIALTGTRENYGAITVPLPGAHQFENCATAIAAIEASGLNVGVDAVRRGIAATRWPGRFQIVRSKPLTILDGAHNPDGARALAAALREQVPDRKLAFILGVLRDKNYPEVCRILAPLASRILCAPVANDRSATADEIARACLPARAEVCRDVVEANEKCSGEDVVVITGSLFLVGEAMSRLGFASAVPEQERRLQ